MDYLAIFVLTIFLINLYSKVGRLESLISENTKQSMSPNLSEVTVDTPSQVVSTEVAQVPQSVSATTPLSPVNEIPTQNEGKFIAWLRDDWMVKIGAFLLFLGVTWFISYAFANNWIGPMGRIALGIIFGAAVMLFGWFRMNRYTNQGGVFLALGTAIVIFSIYAGRSIYDFFTPLSALSVMFFTVLFSAIASLKTKTEWLAWMSVLSAYFIPVMASVTKLEDIELFTYLFLVTIGVIWLTLYTSWRKIFITALAAVTIYSMPYWMDGFVTDGALLVYGFAFTIVFFVANLVSFLTLPKERNASIESIGAVWVSVILSGWIFAGVGDDLQSLVFAMWAVVFLVSAYLFSEKMNMKKPFLAYAGVGTILIGIATAIELDGEVLTIAFLLESLGLILLSRFVVRNQTFERLACATFIVPGLLSLKSLVEFPVYPEALFSQEFFVVLLTMSALAIVGYVFLNREPEREGDRVVTIGALFTMLASLYSCFVVWLVLHAVASEMLATFLSLFLYMVVGVTLYVRYKTPSLAIEREYRMAGLLLIAFVLGHLLLVDIWNMDLLMRIITFFIIGALLMSTAFVKKFKK